MVEFLGLNLVLVNSFRWPVHVINSADNAKLPCCTLPPTQHHSFFRKRTPVTQFVVHEPIRTGFKISISMCLIITWYYFVPQVSNHLKHLLPSNCSKLSCSHGQTSIGCTPSVTQDLASNYFKT